ncbi:hypothetical protein [Microbacterium sp. cx-59]|uniref:hypothetical protein n=1 Tax=Microbacterium sp. cx-59 TaxID=2891207 RepID=UPI001E3E8D95|nr:hypothetical protein [Microbacterium sp. cx-59]MCC4908460.1 hypothetical protein [Microbacterium sp. cx-59]
MKNRKRAAAAGVLLVATALAGCAEAPAPAETSSVEARPVRGFEAAACNLGEQFDQDAMVKRARYDSPAASEYDLERYGPMIANNSCSDAQIIKWQELRRELGESDTICRVVYYDDVFSSRTYPIGCAVPVMVVTDASR